MPTGTVKFFNADRGFGFVTPNGSSGNRELDVFVHASALHASGISVLLPGDEVEFDVVLGQGGKTRAQNIRKAGRAAAAPVRFGVSP